MDPNSPEAMAQALQGLPDYPQGAWDPQPTPKQAPPTDYMGDYFKTLWGPSWAEKAQGVDRQFLQQGATPQINQDYQNLMRDTAMAGIYAGPTAKTADLNKLFEAQRMEKMGAPREDIWDTQKWFRGQDAKWRFPISDQDLQVIKPGSNRWQRLYNPKVGGQDFVPARQVMEHPQLFEAYPDMADINMRIDYGPQSGKYTRPNLMGAPDPGKEWISTQGFSNNELRGSLAHELTHGVQQRSGFHPGTSLSYQLAKVQEDFPHWVNEAQSNLADKNYLTSPGEAEARQVQQEISNPRLGQYPWERHLYKPSEMSYDPKWLKYQDPETQKWINALRIK